MSFMVPPSFVNPMSDLDILQFSLAYEYLEFAQYQKTLMSGVLSGNDLALVTQFSRNEASHITALQQTIQMLGSQPIQPQQAYNLPNFTDRNSALQILDLFCDTGASAYLGAAPLIRSNDLLITGVRFHNVETLQASALRDASGLAPSPFTVAKGRTPAEIVQIITPYLAAPGSVAAPPPPQPTALVQGSAAPTGTTAPAATTAATTAPVATGTGGGTAATATRPAATTAPAVTPAATAAVPAAAPRTGGGGGRFIIGGLGEG